MSSEQYFGRLVICLNRPFIKHSRNFSTAVLLDRIQLQLWLIDILRSHQWEAHFEIVAITQIRRYTQLECVHVIWEKLLATCADFFYLKFETNTGCLDPARSLFCDQTPRDPRQEEGSSLQSLHRESSSKFTLEKLVGSAITNPKTRLTVSTKKISEVARFQLSSHPLPPAPVLKNDR